MSLADHYDGLILNGQAQFALLKADTASFTLFTKSHNLSADYEKFSNAITGRPEAEIMNFAVNEYNRGLYSLSVANYRNAFSSLRLMYELFSAAIYFSAYEIKLRKWMISLEDINWAPLVDRENGIYSNQFIKPFGTGLENLGSQYQAIASRVYRECSEYVHGNYPTHTEASIKYDNSLVIKWSNISDSIMLTLAFAYASRYLTYLTNEQKSLIRDVLLEQLSSLDSIRSIYS